MAQLLAGRSISKSFTDRPLFSDLTVTLQEGDRLGMVGPNGTGKSTLLHILAGLEEPDDGEVILRRGARVALVAQRSDFGNAKTVREVVEVALANEADGVSEESLHRALGRCGFHDHSTVVTSLSGGWSKRLQLAVALAREPDLLLLDEPTNHLDLESVLWLEELLGGASFAWLVVSHDRYLLEQLPRRMLEMNSIYPSGAFLTDGHYSDLLEKKEAFLAVQARREESLRARMKVELEWLRRGPKARATKAQARIDAAGRLEAELGQVANRNRSERVSIDLTGTGRRSKRLLVTEGLSLSRGGKPLFSELDLVLGPGSRIGLVGSNGCGKTSLLKVLTGELKPDQGKVARVEGVRIELFDQHREGIDPAQSLRRALAPEGDHVLFRDQRLHVVGWARRFQFGDERLDCRVGMLSGGELARLHIARLMTTPADILLLDEPTNDLDIDTLEELEESLESFPGAIVLVTHDRFLLDRLCDAVIGFDGSGGATAFADHRQWDQARRKASAASKQESTSTSSRPKPAKKRLSYLEQREWDGLPGQIETAEKALAKVERDLVDPAIASNAAKLGETYGAVKTARAAVDRLYERWAELENKQVG